MVNEPYAFARRVFWILLAPRPEGHRPLESRWPNLR